METWSARPWPQPVLHTQDKSLSILSVIKIIQMSTVCVLVNFKMVRIIFLHGLNDQSTYWWLQIQKDLITMPLMSVLKISVLQHFSLWRYTVTAWRMLCTYWTVCCVFILYMTHKCLSPSCRLKYIFTYSTNNVRTWKLKTLAMQ